ncbi:hypothetical protein FQN50_005234 [Emmonsiellopsis sp. PD_5]|nr:hypothetical protein FQN50_005234 [Emmonsiellopsis sp. PD_5]
MLERTAQRLENAGECILRNSKGLLRTQRELHPDFWRHGAADIDAPLWSSDFLSSSRSFPAITSPAANLSPTPNRRLQNTHLEFLYPPQAQAFARYYLHTTVKGSVKNRRRLGDRAYSSSQCESTPAQEETVLQAQAEYGGVRSLVKPVVGYRADGKRTDGVHAGVEETLKIFEESRCSLLWNQYQSLKPADKSQYRSRILAYLSNSRHTLHRKRSLDAFYRIDVEHRTSEDYFHVTKLLLRDRTQLAILREVCKEALSRFKGQKCWDLAFTTAVDRMWWDLVHFFWKNKPYAPKGSPPLKLRSTGLANLKTLPERLMALLEVSKKRNDPAPSDPAVSVTRYLLLTVIHSREMMRFMPIEQILLLFYRFHHLGLLQDNHLANAVFTLQSLDIELQTSHAIQVYWQYRLLMPSTPPRESLLLGLLRTICKLQYAEEASQLLEEYRLFYGKPGRDAYEIALVLFSRLGDAKRVNELFEAYVEDHGRPSDLHVLSNLINVHAASGNVSQARKMFMRLRDEFSVTPNQVCWNILITAHANAGDTVGANSTVQKMVKAGFKPTAHTIGILMGLFAKHGSVEAVMKFLHLANSYNIKPNMNMIHPVVETLCNHRKYDAAEKFADMAMQLKPAGSITRMWNIILFHYAFLPDISCMLGIHKKMKMYGVEFDDKTHAATMLAFIRTGNHDDALELLRKLESSRRIPVTKLHYSLLLYGYYRISDLNMVSSLYNELIEKFGSSNSSAKLTMLKAQIQKDWHVIRDGEAVGYGQEVRLKNAEQFLEIARKEFDVKDVATKEPQPGLRKASVRQSFPGVFFQELISAYGAYGAVQRPETLIAKLRSQEKHLPQTSKFIPFPQLAVEMKHHLKSQKFEMVERTWTRAFQQAVDLGTLPTFFTDDESKSTKDRAQETTDDSSPSRMFSLSYCLSVLMECYAKQNLFSKIAVLVSHVQKSGFVLTSHNWSTYIELLSASRRSEDRLNAFVLFERLFIPQFTGWRNAWRRSNPLPSNAPFTLGLLEDPNRATPLQHGVLGAQGMRAWAKIEPDYMIPAYTTVVRLAAALVDTRSRAILDGGNDINALVKAAPMTVIALGNIREARSGFGRSLDDARERLLSRLSRGVMEPMARTGIVNESGTQLESAAPKEDLYTDIKPPSPIKLIPIQGGRAADIQADMGLVEALLAEDAKWRAQETQRLGMRRRFLGRYLPKHGIEPRFPDQLSSRGKESQHWDKLRRLGLRNRAPIIQRGHLELPESKKETGLSASCPDWRKEEAIWRQKVANGQWENWISQRAQNRWIRNIGNTRRIRVTQYYQLEHHSTKLTNRYRKEWFFWCRFQIWKRMSARQRTVWELYLSRNRGKRWRGLRAWRRDRRWIYSKMDQRIQRRGYLYYGKSRLDTLRDMMDKVYTLAKSNPK